MMVFQFQAQRPGAFNAGFGADLMWQRRTLMGLGFSVNPKS
jgi:hypothetical protein